MKQTTVALKKEQDVERIPYLRPEFIAELPDTLQELTGMILSTTMPDMDKRKLAWGVLASASIPDAVRVEKIVYGGALRTTAFSIDPPGNPDKLPPKTYETMSLDPIVALGTAMIKAPLIGLPWRIDCHDLKVKGILEESISRCISQIVTDMLDAIRFGHTCGQLQCDIEEIKVEDINESGRRRVLFVGNAAVLTGIRFMHPKTFKYLVDDMGDLIGARQTHNGKKMDLGVDNMFHFGLEVEYGNWYGKSRYKYIYKEWYWRALIVQFLLRYIERRSIPSTVVEAPPGKTKSDDGEVDNLTMALNIGKSIISNSVAVLPTQYDKQHGHKLWDIHYLTDSNGRTDVFIGILNYMSTMIMRGLWVPDRAFTSDVGGKGGGTFSQSLAHFDGFLLVEESLITAVEAAINKYIIPRLLEYNVVPEERAKAIFKFDRLNYQRKVVMKEVFNRMLMIFSGSAREGNLPKLLPSIRSMAKTLDIPLDPFEDLFNTSGSSGDDSDDSDLKAPKSKDDQKEKDNRDNRTTTRPSRGKRTGNRGDKGARAKN